jgi:hypothetical protein
MACAVASRGLEALPVDRQCVGLESSRPKCPLNGESSEIFKFLLFKFQHTNPFRSSTCPDNPPTRNPPANLRPTLQWQRPHHIHLPRPNLQGLLRMPQKELPLRNPSPILYRWASSSSRPSPTLSTTSFVYASPLPLGVIEWSLDWADEMEVYDGGGVEEV